LFGGPAIPDRVRAVAAGWKSMKEVLMKISSYLKGAFATTYNIILNALTLGRHVWLEGRVKDGIFQNWARRFRYQPSRFIQPTTERGDSATNPHDLSNPPPKKRLLHLLKTPRA